MEMRSPLARVRGLGSSNDGIHHWWVQRLTGIALIPLVLWFVFYAVALASADLATVKAWVGAHYNPVLLILLIICMFHHGQLGLQVVIEDYIHKESVKVTSLLLVKGGALLLGACSAFAVLRLTFEG
ncbi:MAG: succinate dehydrogenase, hydrophobic membrane anchor protein [Rhodospirillaceae bacterium]|nr:succinate dehydrogenase, hydrophobic membrane anchor protein [Rhodospirillaceae bacterium]MBT5299016.1 succinate dehydrogenase, hydrophobic membrane anchor protein [Rhodospirillaceae bacterium]MBT5514919.1 succinate dehydrogenase, hydrophobic membrane anchor protein [Rhodospirillaceae bacterium]MBT6086127.1 succinate dehydrogenase, hydrophobic membrane anchor protein [Rhodospirillaceae bacterium]MBT6609367.1 succinate dehydrogenase, hydrophobic membrane anchor protein [Rhodospirillaceae bact